MMSTQTKSISPSDSQVAPDQEKSFPSRIGTAIKAGVSAVLSETAFFAATAGCIYGAAAGGGTAYFNSANVLSTSLAYAANIKNTLQGMSAGGYIISNNVMRYANAMVSADYMSKIATGAVIGCVGAVVALGAYEFYLSIANKSRWVETEEPSSAKIKPSDSETNAIVPLHLKDKISLRRALSAPSSAPSQAPKYST